MSSFNGSLSVEYGLIESNNLSKDVTDNYFGASSYIEPAPMLTLYVPLIVVNEDEHRRDKFPEKILIKGTEEESISFHSEPALVPVNYGQCCLWSKEIVATCGTLYLDYFDWKRQCYTFAYLAERDIRPHFQNLRVINKNILIDDSMSICPKYRSFFGIDWCDVLPRCNHPDDDSKYRPPASGCHRANLSMCSRIEGFTIGGRLCSKHRKLISVSPDSESITCQSQFTNSTPCFIEDTRDTMNRILAEANLSPIRSHTRMALQRQSKSEKLAETLAPDQGKELLLLAGLEIDADKKIK
ncbi:unnamed protein product [Rotaria socialis]|uniref:Uncharacterized protein n=1 Tax=Rotaria socialis TaxID=392032 RepID=A0A821I9Z7_9BILA|nr:unnamed protein product [Rotaria socialis]